MPLSAGLRVGPYEIVSPLGAGGMGEVYRAHDTRLGREVALKVLPAHLSSDADARARFEREARSVAALNHPHILALFDFGQDAGVTYAVTELLDGKTLRDHLTGDRLPARRGLEIARQIAAGLAAAHDKGIVHRDLKPENVFISRDGTVKILDFGLARAVARGRDNAPTLAAVDVQTGAGTILGTVGYMSPEQVRAQEADHRADIFAFGAVLYEILSGRKAFQAETAPEVMTAILREDPPELARVVSGLTPALDRIVRRCLEKDPEHRFQSARDLGFALDAIGSGDSAVASGVAAQPPLATPSRQIGWPAALIVVVALMTGAAFALGGFGRRASPDARSSPLTVFQFDVPFVFNPTIEVSPDGRTLAYNAPAPASRSATGSIVWIRPLDSAAARPLPTISDVARGWSADSRSLLVVNGRTLASIDVATGQRTVLGDLPGPGRGIAWAPDGSVIAAGPTGIVRVQPGVGQPVMMIPLDVEREAWVGQPAMTPDGRRFLYAVMPKSGTGESDIRLASLDGSSGGTTIGLSGAVGPSFVAPDVLAYVKAGTLYAQAFDPDAGKVAGTPIALGQEVFSNATFGTTALGSSLNGVIAYRSETFPAQTFVWVDRAGRTIEEFPKRDTFTNFDLSPDGTRVAVTVRQGSANPNPLWLLDLARGLATNVSEKTGTHSDATWSPDSTQLAFRLDGSVVSRAVNGGPTRRLLDGVGYPETWSPDGRYIVAGRPGAQIDSYSLIGIDVTGGQPPTMLVNGGTGLDEPRFSPDGKWLTYNDVEPGRTVQIYAIPFPPTGQRYQLSTAGGTQARWRRDGRELFYLAPDATMMTVQIPDGDVRRASPPSPLFRAGLETSASFDQFAPSADGQRFLLRRPIEPGGDRAPVHVIVNFDLKSRLAAESRPGSR